MTDIVDSRRRSEMMAGIKGRNTAPKCAVRRVARDRRNEEAMRDLGWRVLVIWECETRDEGGVRWYLEESVELCETVQTPGGRCRSSEQRGGADAGR